MIQRFLDYLAIERKYSPRTVQTYRDDLSEFCAFLGLDLDQFDPTKVDETDVKTWVFELAETRHNAPRSVHQKLSALHSLYRYLLREGIVARDITRRVILPKLDKPLPKFFKPSEMKAFEEQSAISLQASDEAHRYEVVRDNLIIEMLYQTGMRQAELLGLRDTDLDLTECRVRIFGKRRKERIVPIGDSLATQIKEYIALRDEEAANHQSPISNNQFFPGLTKNTLYNIVRTRMGEVSTQQKRSPHVLRHTFATTMLNNGADIRTIQTLLGHASLRATQIYTHATFSQIQEAYQKAHPRAKRKPKDGN